MLKRLAVLLLISGICVGILASCNKESDVTDPVATEPVDTDNPAVEETEKETKATQKATEKKEPTNIPNSYFDYNKEHLFFATDSKGRMLLMYDMNKCIDEKWTKLRNDDAIVWEWGEKSGITCAKLRYSEYYKKNVVIISTNKSGWCGIVDYETKETLWSAAVHFNSHGIEMLPSGDVVVIGSEPGRISYFPLTKNGESKAPSSQEILLSGAHDAVYDPDRDTLWVVYDYGVQGYKVDENDQLVKTVNVSFGDTEEDIHGHAIAACYGQKGKYLVSGWKHIYMFDAETGTMTRDLVSLEVKGIAYFEDGTMVTTRARVGTYSESWLTNTFNIRTWKDLKGEKKPADSQISVPNREFYKVITANTNYN